MVKYDAILYEDIHIADIIYCVLTMLSSNKRVQNLCKHSQEEGERKDDNDKIYTAPVNVVKERNIMHNLIIFHFLTDKHFKEN